MSVTATVILIISAFTHAGWNFFSKKENPTLAFYLVTNLVGVLCVLPIFSIYRHQIPLIPPLIWGFLICSGFFLAVYMAFLAGAYRTGDFSVAYPLARSLPAIIVTSIALMMGKTQTIGPAFTTGVLMVTVGCLILPIQRIDQFSIRNYLNMSCLLAVMAAVCIAGYTMVDGEAMAAFRATADSSFNPLRATLIYLALEAVICTVWEIIIVLCSARERKSFALVLKRSKLAAAKTGIGIYLTYGLVLLSMNFVTNVSYVAAFRQLSIPIGAIMGMVFLGEARYLTKISGLITIFSGLVLLTFSK